MTPLTRWQESFRRANADRLAEFALQALPGPFIPWSNVAMRPAGLLLVLNDIWFNRRTQVVECGGGMSTIYIARLLKQLGEGRLTSVEHDPTWGDRLRAQLTREGLQEQATVVHAPLTTGPSPWYDTDCIPRVKNIDLLIVDGPIANTAALGQARYPALPHFRPDLIPGATVVLDDILREGEQAVLRRWTEEFNVRLSPKRINGAIAIGQMT
jgi:predicted O-methyltransferase YrrM